MMKSKKQMANTKKHTPFYKRKVFLWTVGTFIGVVLIVLLAFRVSPWPGVLVIRSVFDKDSSQKLTALKAHEPSANISVLQDKQYIQGDKDAMLDVYIPTEKASAERPLPIVVWTHGGAWLSGDKSDAGPYYKLIADKGFIVVALNYTLAPEKTYPAQIHQINAAHAYIKQNAASYYGDSNKIILAGDSAGSQLSSQMAAIITNPAYASQMDITPSLSPSNLAATVLFCGIFKMEGLTHPNESLSKIVSWGDDITTWAYTGTRNKDSPLIREMSPYYYVDGNFPTTFISGGNNDPLTNNQSVPFAEKLESLGVNVTTLFYESDHSPGLPHEYQFNLDNADGAAALKKMGEFLEKL